MEDINIAYLSFKVGEEIFALHASKVLEIREYEKPRNMPGKSAFMSGVMDYQKEVIPLIDTGIKFGMEPVKITSQTCIIIIDVERLDNAQSFRVGILTDEVTDVFEAEEGDFKQVDSDYSPQYIKATYSSNGNFYLILNSDHVFSKNEVLELKSILEQIKQK